MQGGAIYVRRSTLNLEGCKFAGNSDTSSGGDVYCDGDRSVITVRVYIDGCPAGSSGSAVANLETYGYRMMELTGEAKSYSCGACVR